MTEAPVRNATRKSALIVVDVQKAVMQGTWQADLMIARIASLIDRARQDGVPVIFVQHEAPDMQAGSDGWQIVAAITPRNGDIVVGKCFQDSFAQTSLKEVLTERDIGHLVIAGAQTDACIRATTVRALLEGFDMTLVEDAHTTNDATFDMTDSELVSVSAKQIIAHTNMCLNGASYPGVTCRIEPHDRVVFAV